MKRAKILTVDDMLFKFNEMLNQHRVIQAKYNALEKKLWPFISASRDPNSVMFMYPVDTDELSKLGQELSSSSYFLDKLRTEIRAAGGDYKFDLFFPEGSDF